MIYKCFLKALIVSLSILWFAQISLADTTSSDAEEGRYSAENQTSVLSKRHYRTAKPAHKLTPQWTERYIYKHQSDLLKGSRSDHVMAFYFFGGIGQYTLMGMERVRGDDYQEFLTLFVFKERELIGYYSLIADFPKEVAINGEVIFPKGVLDKGIVNLAKEQFEPLWFDGKAIAWHAVEADKQ